MLATVTGVFRIAGDIELRYLPSGSAVAKVNLVNSSKYKTQSGEQKEDTCFINGTVFGKSAEIINQYCQKGSKIFIKGELKQDTWTDQNNNKRSAHSIKISSFEFLDAKPQQQKPKVEVKPATQSGYAPEINISEDSIPF